MLFSDAAWIAFSAINSGSLQIQAQRYGSFITQMFPAVGSKLGLSLKADLVLYSLSFNLFYFVTGYILFRMRRYALVVLLAFFHTLFLSDAYFWTNNEVYQGVTWMFLMLGTISFLYDLHSERPTRFYLVAVPLFIPLAFFSIYTHPAVMMPTAFLWVFFAVSGKERFFRILHSLPFILIIAAITVFKMISSSGDGYDGNILNKVFKSNIGEIIGTFTSGMADIFWKNLLHNHWLVAFIFLAGIIYLLKQRRYLVAVCTICACLTYFILICLSFSGGSKPYIESEWSSLAVLGAAPFAYFIVPAASARQVIISMSVIFIVRFIYIAVAFPTYDARITMINSITNIMRERGVTKAIIRRADDRLEKKSIISWALPVETIFTSVLDGDTVQRTALCLNDDEINRVQPLQQQKAIILPFWTTPVSELNTRYFKMDTTKAYRIYTFEEFFGNKMNVLY